MSLHRQLQDSTGLVLPADVVERAVRERMLRLGLATHTAYAPQPGTPEFDALVDLVVVPESWMFRDPDVFETALRFVQRRLLSHPGRQLRLLSLPCAGGEEPYSMAMALARVGIEPGMCRIDAVDLSHAALARARLGRYTRNAFRGADLAFRDRWFRRDGDDYVIDDTLRRYVCFSQGNLLAAQHRGDGGDDGRYDLVFCRNLLIYFDDAGRAAAVAAIHALLLEDGLLLSGFAEAPVFCRAGFAPQSLHSAYALQKQAVATVRRRPRPAPVHAPAPVKAQAATQAVASPAAQLSDAQRLADAGRLLDAELACRAVLALQPELAEAWFLLGLIDECGGQGAAAERHLRRCLYLQPDHYEALCSLALLHEERGDAAEGALLRQRAARAHARHPDAGAHR
jgi:chemotaxis protein methyltransferase WspC